MTSYFGDTVHDSETTPVSFMHVAFKARRPKDWRRWYMHEYFQASYYTWAFPLRVILDPMLHAAWSASPLDKYCAMKPGDNYELLW